MSKTQKTVAIFSTIGFLGIVMLGFQNCSKTRFTEAPGATILKTAEIDGSTQTTPGDDGVTAGAGDGEEEIPPGDYPTYPQEPTPPVSDGKKNPPKGPPSGDVHAMDLVECQMLHPNKKVVLGSEFEVSPSNSSSHRVCMSRHACLDLINAYAIRHECSLAPGAGQDANQVQCTEIFPGSKGTCHNATILSDDQVSEILDLLASK
ncbi:hypothetical protein [Bdellovibrio sp. HCB337]|uniref:hypothetical protein n=1 Tax=Bdellovibrio sp. HCB337 TaxID=3394358 RepID=UPI0039A52DAD